MGIILFYYLYRQFGKKKRRKKKKKNKPTELRRYMARHLIGVNISSRRWSFIPSSTRHHSQQINYFSPLSELPLTNHQPFDNCRDISTASCAEYPMKTGPVKYIGRVVVVDSFGESVSSGAGAGWRRRDSCVVSSCSLT